MIGYTSMWPAYNGGEGKKTALADSLLPFSRTGSLHNPGIN